MKKLVLFLFLGMALLQDVCAQLPKLQLKSIDGKVVNVNKIPDGENLTIISFFATWCHPCIRELSAIHELYPDWQDETGVRLVAVSIDNSVNSLKVKPLVRSKGWDYEVLLDENGALKRAMNVELIPSVFIVDGKGEIIWRHAGYVDGGEQEIYRELIKAIR